MNWLKKNIQNIKDNKKIRILLNIILFSMAIIILIAQVTDIIIIDFYLIDNNIKISPNLLTFKAQILKTLVIIFILNLLLNKKMMIIVWFIAFSIIIKSFLLIPDFYKQHVYEMCADINCDAKEYLIKNPEYKL